MSKQPEAANLNSEKTKDIRMTNIIAARGMSISNFNPTNNLNKSTNQFHLAVADVVRTSLGPRGMDKMVSSLESSFYANPTITDPRH